MQTQFKVLSLSHEKAPLAVRELFHLDNDACTSLSLRLREILDLEEVMVLSTCNRTEIYYMSASDRSGEILGILCLEKGLPGAEKYERFFEWIDEAAHAVRHLFAVSMGLKSAVIGDLQISNQVKQAYARAAELKLAGPFIHRLLHTIFHCNKRVQQETEYRDGAASVSYAAAELAKELIAFHQAPRVLVIGLGEMGVDVARNLCNGKFERVAVMNRTLEKAEALAAETGVECLPYEEMATYIKDFNVVITAVQTPEPIINRTHIQPQAAFNQKFLIDLSVPRGIDSNVTGIPGVLLYDIDEIRTRTSETVARRMQAVPRVKAIIEEEMVGFNSWSRELAISPTINKLKESLEQIRKEELARFLRDADSAEAKKMEDLTKSMMNKIIKLPVLHLKAACKRGEQETLIDVLNDLFDLERAKVVAEE